MKNKRLMVALAAGLWVITTAGAFVVGLIVDHRQMSSIISVGLDNTQAELLFNRIDNENHVSDLLKKGCTEQASQFIDYTTDNDMQLMHEFVLEKKMDEALSYIKVRNPAVLKEAATYSPRFPNPWEEKACP